jgi:hypothetical protein
MDLHHHHKGQALRRYFHGTPGGHIQIGEGLILVEGFPGEAEKICTRGDISLRNKYLRALSTREGYRRVGASASNPAPTSVQASQLAVSRNSVFSTC